jgi:hypothetical protein
MTWYPDLSPCDYFGLTEPDRLLTVGWLAEGKSFPTGITPSEVLGKIERLSQQAPRIFVFRGFHICELCGSSADDRLVDDNGRRIPSSSHLNIFVPHGEKLFVAPQCLPHYIAEHEYLPPGVFCDAVLSCPEPNSDTLVEKILKAGGPEFAKEFARFEYIRARVTGTITG